MPKGSSTYLSFSHMEMFLKRLTTTSILPKSGIASSWFSVFLKVNVYSARCGGFTTKIFKQSCSLRSLMLVASHSYRFFLKPRYMVSGCLFIPARADSSFFNPARLTPSDEGITFMYLQAARSNMLLAVPALLYAINNYLKFIMQLYFNPATVKMLSNLKVLVIAILLKIVMRRRFSVIQWEALALLLIGISINQLKSFPEGTSALGLPVTTGAYVYTLIFVTVPSMASVFNEYALKSQYDTSIYLQNLFLYGYGAIFNFLGILASAIFKGPSSFNILEGHSKATMLLICNNAAQGILSSFFFKYADTILKKYSSTVATIFTGIASAVLFGHTLTINFMLGISVVFISMHQFFSPLSKPKDDQQNGVLERVDVQDNHRSRESSFINMAAGANEEATHRVGPDERLPLLPT